MHLTASRSQVADLVHGKLPSEVLLSQRQGSALKVLPGFQKLLSQIPIKNCIHAKFELYASLHSLVTFIDSKERHDEGERSSCGWG